MERPGGSAEAPDEAAPLLPRPPPPPSSGLCSARCSLALLAHGSLLVAYALRAALSIAIIAITGGPPSANRSAPGPRLPQAPAYNWSAETQGIVLSSFFYGYGLTQALGGYGAGLLGGKLVLGSGLLLSSALTLLVPRAAELGAGFLVGLQALLGLAQGVIFPAQYTLWAKWAPPLERSRLMNIADAGCTFGTFSALLVAGFICQSLGWPLVFYIFGSGFGGVCPFPSFAPRFTDTSLPQRRSALLHRTHREPHSPQVAWAVPGASAGSSSCTRTPRVTRGSVPGSGSTSWRRWLTRLVVLHAAHLHAHVHEQRPPLRPQRERAPLLPALHWERAGAHPGGAAGRFPPGPAGARNSSCQEALLSTGDAAPLHLPGGCALHRLQLHGCGGPPNAGVDDNQHDRGRHQH
ncbi:sodium-dependent phosphate transport protein 3-like isoform X4 [Anas platyrhynchos]|uniref:sodium-dependent phosphate transport protein 3-like isoform X4 n=1 Tax=Anas platyrhynchos TaxID=8839 RepID=UPI003AF2B5D6